MEDIKTVKGAKRTVKIVPHSKERSFISKSDAEMDARAKHAVKTAVDKAKFCGKPVAKYDVKEKKAYLQYPDGRRVDVR